MPADEDLPSTLRRSPKKAQDTWVRTRDSAIGTYGEGERARRTAYAALKHSYEKVGDHWERKEGGRRGPSDPQAARGAGQPPAATAGGVDEAASRDHLLEVAKRLGIRGRAKMPKPELVEAIEKANRRATTKARTRSG
jgi:cation transport regulator ChaB